MNKYLFGNLIKQKLRVSIVTIKLFGLFCLTLSANSYTASLEDYVASPPFVTPDTEPLVMLVMSNDNQLWHKAYNDYSDLDEDGTLDTTYNDNFDYYGYFNTGFCYTYNSTNNVFTPNSPVTSGHKCSSAASEWSGNFLNWLTMTRIDIVRKVLYGGLRSVDTTSATVLQRALIPSDNHAFVKVVRDSEIDGTLANYTPISNQSVMSFCNVTDFVTGGSDITRDVNTSDNPPLIKLAIGDHFAWSGSELNQCQYTDEGGSSRYSPDRPNADDITGVGQVEFSVRIDICVNGKDQDSCEAYTAADGTETYKPRGLLQSYGEDGNMKFGLLTGSYNNKDKGGVLRKNISFMGGSEASASDLEINPETGVFINQSTSDDGIINTLNRLRIQGWDYSESDYVDCADPGISISDFLTSTVADEQCRDWGNPIAELYLEALRYFAGATSATSAFNSDDSSIIPGLDQVSWLDPLSADNACAQCSIVLLSTGLNSFDGDDLSSASDLPGLSDTSDVQAQTNAVGVAEGIAGNNYIIGNGSSGGTAGTCDTKTLTDFSDAIGLCPELPQLRGTYNLAGLSYYAHQNDLRGLLDGEQTVETYTVALAESLPSFEIKTSNNESVSFVPSCRSNSSGSASLTASGWADCSIVDVTIKEQTSDYGLIFISWEDSYWGNDYDMDAYSVIEYCTATGSAAEVQAACPTHTTDANPSTPRPDWQAASDGGGEIQMRVSVVGASAGFALKFGFVMNGSDADGTYINLLRPGSQNFNSVALTGSDTNWVYWDSVRKFTAVVGTPDLLENPLWYAAKYGNFEDSDNSKTPNLVTEWDTENFIDASASEVDGLPDAYFPVKNPVNLEEGLKDIFNNIAARVASGSAAAAVATSSSGQGMLVQGLYKPLHQLDSGDSLRWVGILHSLFIDSFGNFREDHKDNKGNRDQMITNADPIIKFEFDEKHQKTTFTRYKTDDEGETFELKESGIEIENLETVWNARDELSKLTNLTSQRAYTDIAERGRHIFTGLDINGDGIVNRKDVGSDLEGNPASFDRLEFSSKEFPDPAGDTTQNRFRYLGLSDADSHQAPLIIDYIRGQEIKGFRSRSIDFDNSSEGEEVWRLGDIVSSSPLVVGPPKERYDVLYGDDTYVTFKNDYTDRRQVVYAGANDGMLHAFNGGFYNKVEQKLVTSLGGKKAHPLGSELWAYVPYNVLPHLQWLTRTDYSHVYYIDGIPQVFDVNISDVWKTILVVGLGFGGGEFPLEVDNDGDGHSDFTRSSYIILDITDPESEPRLIAEVSHEQMGYTTSRPTLIKKRKPAADTGSYANPATNEWYLVFGSGPHGDDDVSRADALNKGESNQTGKIFIYNLKTLSFETSSSGDDFFNVPYAVSGFIGDLTSVDWDGDFIDDAVYFGTVRGTVDTPSGDLVRMTFEFGSEGVSDVAFSKLIGDPADINAPFTAPPHTTRSTSGDYWVHVGSGRFLVPEDNSIDTQQRYYGIKETDSSMEAGSTIALSTMVNTTGIQVFVDNEGKENSVRDANKDPLEIDSTPIGTFNELRAFIKKKNGWYFDLDRDDGGRHVGLSGQIGANILFNEYIASGEKCSPLGETFENGVHFEVGVANPAPFFGIDPTNKNGDHNLVKQKDKVAEGLSRDVITVEGLGPRPGAPIPCEVGKTCEDPCGPGTKRSNISNMNQGSGGGPDLDTRCVGIGAKGRASWREILIGN